MGPRLAPGEGIAVDHDGNALVAGPTSTLFPTTPGAFRESSAFGDDGRVRTFVTKLDSTGSALLYSTLLGGYVDNPNTGPFSFARVDVAVDLSGSAVVTGVARQADFPTTPGAFQQPDGLVFVAKLNATGSALDYSSRFAYGPTSARPASHAIALDRQGNAYVLGTTNTGTFPVTTGAFQTAFVGPWDEFVMKLSPVGELVYSTFLGGIESEQPGGIAVDFGGNAYVTGKFIFIPAHDGDFPTTPRAYRTKPARGFVTKLNPSASALVYSTYLDEFTVGSEGPDLVVDAAGRAYVAAGEDQFVTIVEPSGSWVNVSGIQGGSSYPLSESALGIGLNAAANANLWVVGFTNAVDFPTTPNAYQPHRASTDLYGADAFVVKLVNGASPIPGSIEAEEFDRGGEGVGYHDNTAGNQGDAGY